MAKNFYLMSGTDKEVMDTTSNDSVYRKARKRWLETKGLCCSYCQYHRGENRKEYYGGHFYEGQTLKEGNINYPSWKLASKNRKQWMPKNNVKMNIEFWERRWYWSNRPGYYHVSFKIGYKGKRASGIRYSTK